jgi:hypothetical protein
MTTSYDWVIYYTVFLVFMTVFAYPVLMEYLDSKAKLRRIQSLEKRLEGIRREMPPKFILADLSSHSPGTFGPPTSNPARTRWDIIG